MPLMALRVCPRSRGMVVTGRCPIVLIAYLRQGFVPSSYLYPLWYNTPSSQPVFRD